MAAENYDISRTEGHYIKVTQSGLARLDKNTSSLVQGLYTDGLETCTAIAIIGAGKMSLMHATISTNTVSEVKAELAWVGEASACLIVHNPAHGHKRGDIDAIDELIEKIKHIFSKTKEAASIVPTVFESARILLTRDGKVALKTTPTELLLPPFSDCRNQLNFMNDVFSPPNTREIDRQFVDHQWQPLPSIAPDLKRTLATALHYLQKLSSQESVCSERSVKTIAGMILSFVQTNTNTLYFVAKLRDGKSRNTIEFLSKQITGLLDMLNNHGVSAPQYGVETDISHKLSLLTGAGFLMTSNGGGVDAIASCGRLDYFNRIAKDLNSRNIKCELLREKNPLQTASESSPLIKIDEGVLKRCLYTLRIPDIGKGTEQAKAILEAFTEKFDRCVGEPQALTATPEEGKGEKKTGARCQVGSSAVLSGAFQYSQEGYYHHAEETPQEDQEAGSTDVPSASSAGMVGPRQ